MSKLFYNLCQGVSGVRKLHPASESPHKHITDHNKDWYRSLYYYTEEQKNEAELEIVDASGRKILRGTGNKVDKSGKKYPTFTDIKTNELVFDLDNKVDLDAVKVETVNLFNRLVGLGIDENTIQLAFSGNKGFTVLVKLNDYYNPSQIKKIAKFSIK